MTTLLEGGKHTAGPVEIHGPMHGWDFSVVATGGDAELGNWLIAGVRWKENADFIIEAFNVATETGMSPRQLIWRIEELTTALEEIRNQCKNAKELGATGPGFYEDISFTASEVLSKATP